MNVVLTPGLEAKQNEAMATSKQFYKKKDEELSIAVLIPCYNEEAAIGEVVRQFRARLQNATIYVFDNNSSDGTVEKAAEAGALIFHEPRQGKGYVVQAMFRQVEADIYILVDGDGTYPADVVWSLIEPVRRGQADMVIGSRLHHQATSQFRPLNRLGNHIFRSLLNWMFGVGLTDILSGYRVFSKRLVRGLPLLGGGFQTEAEMTIKALQRGFSVIELPVNLSSRLDGSHSKIRIVHDGVLILNTILTLFRDYRPLTFFGGAGLILMLVGLVPGVRVIIEYFRMGTVPRLPSAILAMGLELTGLILIVVGLILHTISRHFQELDLQLQSFAEELRRDRSRQGGKTAASGSGPN